MGVHVILDIDPGGIDAEAWAAVHDETLALLEAWRPRLLGWSVRSVEGATVPMYARSVRCNDGHPLDAHWSVVGDQESLQTAERQSLYRNLKHYPVRQTRPGSAADIVVVAARPRAPDTGGPVRVFGDKTQGHAYHFAMLAAAMVVEERFPRSAMVWGDIDRAQAEKARRMAAPILGRELTLPVRVDAPRLIDRLRGSYDDDALAGAFERVYQDDSGEPIAEVLRHFPGERGAHRWKRAFAKHKSARDVGVSRLIVAWLNAGRDLSALCRFACLQRSGPRFEPEELVDALAASWVAIPRSVREPLDVYLKPAGAAHTVNSLLGSFLLDVGMMGRRLSIHIEPATLAADLSKAFGDRGPALAARLLEQSAGIEEGIRWQAEETRRVLAKAEQRADDDTETLATIGDIGALGPNQQSWVRTLSWSVRKALASLRSNPKVAAAIGDAKQAKRALARMLPMCQTLTEDAWDIILAEGDPKVLAWWIALASLDADEIHASQVRRALFENPALCRYSMALAEDEAEMRKVDALAAEGAAAKAQP